MADPIRPFCKVLDEREHRIPFRLLRQAYEMAADAVLCNRPGETYTARDYWPTCLEEVLRG